MQTETKECHERRYRIVTFYKNDRAPKRGRRRLTLQEAQTHCRREDTHGEGWFDGYEAAEGCRCND